MEDQFTLLWIQIIFNCWFVYKMIDVDYWELSAIKWDMIIHLVNFK